MAEKPCAICPIQDVCIQSVTDSQCPVDGATENDTVKCIYKED